MAERTKAEEEMMQEVKRATLEGLKRLRGRVPGEPLPKAPSELGPPTPHGQEAVGVGYELAKAKRKARRAKIARIRGGEAVA